MMEAYHSLAAENDIIVHGRGGQPGGDQPEAGGHRQHGHGPAWPDAPVLLAGDIDRGGVFAQPLRHGGPAGAQESSGWSRALVINKFRGDVDILRPGLQMLEELTGVPGAGGGALSGCGHRR